MDNISFPLLNFTNIVYHGALRNNIFMLVFILSILGWRSEKWQRYPLLNVKQKLEMIC